MVCKIKFKEAGKRYYFGVNDLTLKEKDVVVVETARGIEIGTVASNPLECPKEINTEIKPILRIATAADLENNEKNIKQEEENHLKIKKCIKKNDLEMKYLSCEYTLDRQKLIIYFESEARVDFRVLVKELAEMFKVRIELRQVGLREGAKMLGGLGPCGLIICCKKYLGEFDNVSIKMAKNQNLSLNPQKISGVCSKLLCCIKYENETYDYYRKGLPDSGDIVKTEAGDAKILSVDVLRKRFKIKNLTNDSFGYINHEEILEIKKFKNENKKPNGSSK